jgi:hypothetical protein
MMCFLQVKDAAMLLELQQDFRRFLLDRHPTGLPAAISDDGLQAEARLQIYRNHVTLALREALRATFPVTHRLVGETFFARLATEFIAAHPPRSPCLNEFGAELSAFVTDFAPAAALPYLSDMARLEWALNQAWHSSIEPPLQAATMATIDADVLANSTLRLQPSLQLITSQWPIEAIWRVNQPGKDGSGVDLMMGGCELVVWREGDDAVFQSVPHGTAEFVRSMLLGQTLHAAFGCNGSADALGFLLGIGLVTGVDLEAQV